MKIVAFTLFAALAACQPRSSSGPDHPAHGGNPPPPKEVEHGGGEGEGRGCICPEIFKPVCGEDGKTYSNDCHATCEHVAIKSQGKCPS